MGLKKEAMQDAEEFARAQMFYGTGAGTRRKLIVAKVESKIDTVPGYADAFRRGMAHQNMAKHATAAQKERQRIDTAVKVKKNIRGVINGDYRSVNISVMVVAAAAYYAHETGYDKKVYDATKKKYRELKAKVKNRKPGTVYVQQFFGQAKED